VIQLDTSFLIRALVRGSVEDGELRRRLGRGEEVTISTVAWTEFLCGPVAQEAVAHLRGLLGAPVPFVEEDARAAADLFNVSGRRRGSLRDCMIAAVAIRCGAPLATGNPADFARFEGLELLR